MRYSIVALIAVVLTSSFALAASVDQLAGTKHNFAAGSYAGMTAGNTITMCEPCHTPHHAVVDAAISTRLWNHGLSTANTYVLYEEDKRPDGVYDGNNDGSQGMDRVSRLCLGCHDGTVALDSFGMGPTGVAAGHVGTLNFVANDVSNLGVDFRDDHPVGISAVALNADGTVPSTSHLKPAVVTYNVAPLTGVKSAKIGALSLYLVNGEGWVVSCKTCHNPHGSGTVANTPYKHLLYVPEAGLCNTCHTK